MSIDSAELPPSPIEEAVEEIEEAVEEAVEEIKEVVSTSEGVKLDQACLDEIVEKTADKVYDKMKAFVGDLVESIQDAEEIALATAPTEPPPTEAPTETEPVEENEPDVKPKTGHRLFHRPLKQKD